MSLFFSNFAFQIVFIFNNAILFAKENKDITTQKLEMNITFDKSKGISK